VNANVNVDVIVNCSAAQLRDGSRLRSSIVAAAVRAGARVHETGSLEALQRVAEGIAARPPSAVVLAGGDGSAMAGISALARALPKGLPPVALVPAGTVGIVAKNVAPENRRDAARVVEAVCDGTTRRTPTATLRVRDDRGDERVGFIFGAGLVAGFFAEYDASPVQGLASAAALAGRAVLGACVGSAFARRMLAPVACQLAIDGTPRTSRAWSLVLASVVRHVGLGVRATYRAGEELERFHVVASTRTPRGLATQVPRVLTGRAMVGPDRVDTLARSLRILFDEEASYILDGDALRARSVTVEAGPVVQLLVAR
jgi:diacylglycerol kinase family enzyme